MSWPLPIRIAGVGSPQGDDAVAWHAVRKLREHLGHLPGVKFHQLDGGQQLLDLLDGHGTLCVIDAVLGENVGTIHRFVWPDRRVEVMRPGSTHLMCPAEALELAATLKILPPHVLIFGVEATDFDPGDRLSSAIQVAIPELVRRIVDEIESEAKEMEGSANHARDVLAQGLDDAVG